MNFTETAAAMRRLADVMDELATKGTNIDNGHPVPMFNEQQAVGAASLIVFLRDLVMASDRKVYDKATLLVMLETVSRDAALFPCGTGTLMWQMED